jgi:hypothetical protein
LGKNKVKPGTTYFLKKEIDEQGFKIGELLNVKGQA